MNPILSVINKSRIVEKALRMESIRLSKVLLAVVERPLRNSHIRLCVLLVIYSSFMIHQLLMCQRLLTCSGICCPKIWAPPSGTTRGRPNAIGGYIRNASCRQAIMYGSCFTLEMLISFSVLKLERTSLVNFW